MQFGKVDSSDKQMNAVQVYLHQRQDKRKKSNCGKYSSYNERSTHLSRFQLILPIVLANAFIADSQPPRYSLLVLQESTHMQINHTFTP